MKQDRTLAQRAARAEGASRSSRFAAQSVSITERYARQEARGRTACVPVLSPSRTRSRSAGGAKPLALFPEVARRCVRAPRRLKKCDLLAQSAGGALRFIALAPDGWSLVIAASLICVVVLAVKLADALRCGEMLFTQFFELPIDHREHAGRLLPLRFAAGSLGSGVFRSSLRCRFQRLSSIRERVPPRGSSSVRATAFGATWSPGGSRDEIKRRPRRQKVARARV